MRSVKEALLKKICVILADGCEEVEAVTPIDYLRRAGFAVTSAGLASREIIGGHGIGIAADSVLDELDDENFDCVVVPGGGKGSEAIAADTLARGFIQRHAEAGALIGALCAAPALVLGKACGLLEGRDFTCYPGLEGSVPGGRYKAERTVRDGRIVTGAGAGCAGEFSIALVEELAGKNAAKKLAAALLLS
ncbi:MAG TPA: DJ-1 family protein [Spirochaetaceae bacterium]|nr:DJ-1 family protein [Spirochaetaceae bacterium]